MAEYPVRLEIPVAWGDMDAFGHVNNTVYFRWFESSRMVLFEQIGISGDRPERVGPILATTNCDFLSPVAYPATVVVGVRVERVGNSSFAMEYEVTKDGAPVARGKTVVVLIDYATGEKIRVPDEMRAAIASLDAR